MAKWQIYLIGQNFDKPRNELIRSWQTRLVFFRARDVNRGTHVYPRMSKGYLQPLVFIIIIFFIFGVTFVQANLCMHILASPCQDGGNPFPVIRLPVVNSVTDSSRHTLLLPALHSQWSRQVYIIHQSITGFLVVQEPTCMHAHEYRLLGASCSGIFWPPRARNRFSQIFPKSGRILKYKPWKLWKLAKISL